MKKDTFKKHTDKKGTQIKSAAPMIKDASKKRTPKGSAPIKSAEPITVDRRSRVDRRDEGKSMRLAVPLASHAQWQAPANRRDPIDLLIESGGDNLAATFSPELADLTIYVIDVAAGDKIPSKGGPGITRSDLLVINKIDLAPYVGADLEVMRRDAERVRGGKPFLFTNCRSGAGLDAVEEAILAGAGLLAGHAAR